MKVMTWNIKKGGGKRLDAIKSVIDAERPDVLTLQELKGWQSGQVGEVASALGMRAHLAPSYPFGQPVAVLVRPPLQITAPRSVSWRLHHAAASVVVPTRRGPLTVVSTHLNPTSPDRRRREAVWLAARYASKRRPVLLAGDLNGLDPGTDHTDELRRLPGGFRHRHLGPDGKPDTRAVAAFLDAGFTDLWGDAPDGRTAPTGLGGAEFSGMRLDYLLGSPPVAREARNVRVVRGGAAERASDHYPVTVELDL